MVNVMDSKEDISAKRVFLGLVCCALALKLFLFFYAELYAPQAKFQTDTAMYLESGIALATRGEFARPDTNGVLHPEIFRTPGYPLFLGIFRVVLGLPFAGIIFVQILLIVIAAFVTFRIAQLIHPHLGYLSALIVLFDPPITIFSLMLLTETLFLFFVTLFLYVFVKYIQSGKLSFLFIAALLAAAIAYIRPIGYFFGLAIGLFILSLVIRFRQKKRILHAFLFLAIVYCLIGLWHVRNVRVSGLNTFTTMTQCAASYRKDYRKDDAITRSLPTIPYYLNAYARCVVALMTEPGTLKEFNRGTLKLVVKIFGYLWVAFWLSGFLIGISRIGNNIYLHFLLWVIFYFVCASIGGSLFGAGYRLRVPMVPCLAIVAAHGWFWIVARFKK